MATSAVCDDAVIAGFKGSGNRLAMWCLLAGAHVDAATQPPAAAGKISHQHLVDAERSMHFDRCKGWSKALRGQFVQKLAGVLEVSLRSGKPSSSSAAAPPCYYQGLHDIASVLMLEVGVDAAVPILKALLQSRLGGFATATMECSSSLLDVMWRLLEAVDPTLHGRCVSAGIQPIFALSWIITWFSHDLESYGCAVRLFDLFLGAHPLMVCYVAVAVLHTFRDVALACALSDESDLYPVLQKLPRRLGGGGDSGGRLSAKSASASGSGGPLSSSLHHTDDSQAQCEWQPTPATRQAIALSISFFRLCPPHILLATCPRAALAVISRDWPFALSEYAACLSSSNALCNCPVLVDAALAGVVPPFDPLRHPSQLEGLQQRGGRPADTKWRSPVAVALASAATAFRAVNQAAANRAVPLAQPTAAPAARCWRLHHFAVPVAVALVVALVAAAVYGDDGEANSNPRAPVRPSAAGGLSGTDDNASLHSVAGRWLPAAAAAIALAARWAAGAAAAAFAPLNGI